jgi:hypothetical protein
LFVPTYQFEHLLEVVNAKIGTYLTIPNGTNEEKFKLTFGTGGTPRPRYLGRSTSLATFCQLSAKANIPTPQPGDRLEKATTLAREDFVQTLEMIYCASKKSGKGKSQKNQRKRIQEHRGWGKSIKRVQRYLGLRETADVELSRRLKMMDLDEPSSILPDQSVRFIAIDVEAWEFDPNLITEVGIAILDTEKIEGVAPGKLGKDWFGLIEAHHIRVNEHRHIHNKVHVHGCAGSFNFGLVLLLLTGGQV